MTVQKITLCLAACFMLVATSATSHAQRDEMVEGVSASDLQFFSPVEFDFENRPRPKSGGWMFRYDKLSWAMTGERATIGNSNVTVLSEIMLPDALTEGFGATLSPLTAADFQYRIINGIQDAAPTADFGWGERYEFGYSNGETSWEVSILDGPAVNVINNFGNGPQADGFGSIHVNFATPANFLAGWRDYTGDGTVINGFEGPTVIINGPGILGDGFIDDLDGDGFGGGTYVLDDINGDGTIDDDEVVGVVYDLDDLHVFNITFDSLGVRNTTELQGFELMKTHHLDNGNRMKKNQNRHLNIGYGFRFLRLRDEFNVAGNSPLLKTVNFTTESENQLVGPQIRAQWQSDRGRWSWKFDGRCMLAYNITDLDQNGFYGRDGHTPGGSNALISAQANTFAYGKRADEFSPTIELRADLSYRVTSALSARLGYTGLFVDNISRSAAITNYSLPDFGLLEGGNQDIFVNGINFGFDVNY